MATSSPPPSGATPRSQRSSRRSYGFSSPDRYTLSDFLRDDRNSELSHLQQLAAAEEEHTRIREQAIHVYSLYEQEEKQRRIQEQQRREEERLQAEAIIAAEHARLKALKAEKAPKPAPEPEKPSAPAPPPPKTEERPASVPQPQPKPAAAVNGVATQTQRQTQPPPQQTPPAQPSQGSLFGVPSPQPPAPPAQTPAAQTAKEFQTPMAKPPQPSPPVSKPQPAVAVAPSPAQAAQVNGTLAPPSRRSDRHVDIHKKLKELRKFMAEQAKVNPALKARMGDMRREIRKSIGQMIGDSKANKGPTSKIIATLTEALQNGVQSSLVNAEEFVLEPRRPVEGAIHNEHQMPSLFIYLVNIFSKAILAQFINECGASPKTADPIGVAAARVFSDTQFLWRGKSLIDILLAKFRVICPVLFGFRGNDKMEQGRLRVGWRREGNGWMPEQQHNDRMTGLGAGFAALSLRDFSRVTKINPFPPTNYWTAMARIVNTPANEMSSTQCVVLKAMIEHHETQFITFYGDAAISALRCALVDFPARAPERTPAVGALQVLGQILRRDTGLRLEEA